MFGKILIANRGEIACRVIRTARRMGIATVAVFSEADAGALHVAMADEAYAIGPAPARESYLRIDAVLDAAQRSGAEAVHPGYGFLAENADFAEACTAAGIVFIGPPAAVIRAMGSKSAAKALMQRAGVPLVPGYHGAAQDEATLAEAARRIGFPVLIKPSAGGGGKGMRVVEKNGNFADALAGARREAKSSFGDDAVLLEKYLPHPRHVEIQIFVDTHGNAVSLFERDCSIQRRHQKIVEEAPAPGLSEAERRNMGEAAIAAARAVGYVGAGTVEFLREGGRFYFMEMNTRLQVEHPVTEMITGQDLVEWQLRVAAGEQLPLRQEDLRIAGHAIEARIYAEDPARDFLPSTGTLAHLRQPDEGPHVRVDTGVRQGDRIGIEYDPLIAKLIVRGSDRAEALRRLSAALAEYEVLGVLTNLPLLRSIAAHPAFARAELDTGFISRHPDLLAPADEAVPALALAAAALHVLLDRKHAAEAAAARTGDPFSPWAVTDSWQPNLPAAQDIVLRHGTNEVTLRAAADGDGSWRLELPDGAHALSGHADDEGMLRVRLDGTQRCLSVTTMNSTPPRTVMAGLDPAISGPRIGTKTWMPGSSPGMTSYADWDANGGSNELTVFIAGRPYTFQLVDPLAPPAAEAVAGGKITAPIPGYVTELMVEPGAEVKRGQPLIVLEAMKMELVLTAPADGTIEAVRVAAGEMVEEGRELILLATGSADTKGEGKR
jgi:3-methylcrotonyl-CoA carboxylase alpha subunit